MAIEHNQRVYGDTCDACGEYQTFGVDSAGLERQDSDEITDRGEFYWLLCDKCRVILPEESEE